MSMEVELRVFHFYLSQFAGLRGLHSTGIIVIIIIIIIKRILLVAVLSEKFVSSQMIVCIFCVFIPRSYIG